MDFSRLELSDDDDAFQRDLRAFLAEIVTDEVIERDRATGENFDEGVHLALGKAGYLAKDYRSEAEGGFTPVQRRIWQMELGRSGAPWFHSGTTFMAARTVEAFADPELREKVLPLVLTGEVRICLGYTEPEGGSDVATCKTRAVRDGDDWVINGAKMFTSNAQNARYCFLLTNTDPTAAKHRSLTMFLVPLDTEGVEIQPLRTVDGDRTNIVYYSDVRVPDFYRIGGVNQGWTVMKHALDAEHGVMEADSSGLQKLATMAEHATLLAEAVDVTAAVVDVSDGAIAYRLGRDVARTEAALSTPDMYGRVANATALREVAPDLMELLGATAVLPTGTPGAADDGRSEYVFRLAGPMGIYGGTLEVFRNMIAQHALGLPRPTYTGRS